MKNEQPTKTAVGPGLALPCGAARHQAPAWHFSVRSRKAGYANQDTCRRLPGARMAKPLFRALWFALLPVVLASMAPPALHAQGLSFAGVQSTVANLGYPAFGLAVDAKGDVFASEGNGTSLVELPWTGSGYGAPITLVSNLSSPWGVAVDAKGDVFIGNDSDSPLLEVPWTGSGYGAPIVVSSNLNYPLGVAVDSKGDVFATSGNTVVEVPWTGSSYGAPTTAVSGLASPYDVVVDTKGDLFIANTYANTVVEAPWTGSGYGALITVAGGLNYPSSLAVDAAGDVFVADTDNSQVVEVPWTGTGYGTPTALVSGLNTPVSVAVDAKGDIFTGNGQTVLEVHPASVNFGSINVGAASQTATLTYNVTASGTLGNITALTQGAPNLDFTLAGGSTCGGAVTAGSQCTVKATFTPKAPGLRMGAVQVTGSSGNLLASTPVYGQGQAPAIAFGPGNQIVVGSGLTNSTGVAVDTLGDLFIADNTGRVVELPRTGTGFGTPLTVASGLGNPYGVAVDGAGDLFIADEGNDQVLEAPWTGTGYGALTTVPTNGLSNPYAVAVDGAGDVFIADAGLNQVVEVPMTAAGYGAQITVPAAGLNQPDGVAVDGAGDVFIADSVNNRVLEVPWTPSGYGVQTLVGFHQEPGSGPGSGPGEGPMGLAVDAAGDVFIADPPNGEVVEVPAGGGAQTTLGSGLAYPFGVAVDAAGDVFIADPGSHVVELQISQPPTLTFAATNVNSTSTDSPQSVAVQNIGNQPLNALAPGLRIGGTNGASFAQVGDCISTFSLTPGVGCNLSINFTPAVSGSNTAAVELTDNALNGDPATQSIPLIGTGIALSQMITFNTIPSQVAGTSISLTASASSNLTVSFNSLTSTVCTISGSSAKLLMAGICTIQATQPGNGVYAAAVAVSQSFTVKAAANFTITPAPSAETVYRGVVGAFILKLQSVNGFNANVTLGCSGGPAGSYCADLPQTVKLNGTALAISGILFPKNSTPGTYVITFTGVSGSLTNKATATFTVK